MCIDFSRIYNYNLQRAISTNTVISTKIRIQINFGLKSRISIVKVSALASNVSKYKPMAICTATQSVDPRSDYFKQPLGSMPDAPARPLYGVFLLITDKGSAFQGECCVLGLFFDFTFLVFGCQILFCQHSGFFTDTDDLIKHQSKKTKTQLII